MKTYLITIIAFGTLLSCGLKPGDKIQPAKSEAEKVKGDDPATDVFLLHDGKAFAKTAGRMLAMDFRLAAHNVESETPPPLISAQALVCCFSRFRPNFLPIIRELAAFQSHVVSRPVDKNSTHCFGSGRKEMPTPFPILAV